MRHKSIYVLILALLPLFGVAQNYTIVVPQKATNVEIEAANEFKYFAKEAIGEDFPIVADNEYNGATNYISVGKTKLSNKVYNKYSPQLKWDGFAVHSDGKNIYLVGNEGKALLYAVYHYWENMVE